MSSHRRAPGIPDVPPFRGGGGGPLQARGVPNQIVTSPDRGYPLDSKIIPGKAAQAMPPPRATASSQQQQQRVKAQQPSSSSARDPKSASSSQSRTQRGESSKESEPRPSSRLANEKKKDYKDPPFIGPWKLGKLIGQGASGRVRHAVHTSTGVQAAIKIVPKQILASSRMSIRDVSAKQDKMTLGIEREIVIMKLIEHPNVLGLMDVYETSKELYLILEYVAGGELFDYLVSKGRLRPAEARAYFRQIIFGLHYCHSFNICHRDLKPENLLLDGSKKTVKVADFGMAALQPSEKMLETSCGSPHYASPEIVSGKSYKGTASDIWSCGIILFALLCGRLPFDDPNIQTLLGKVRLGKFDMPDYLEGHAKDLIWRMLTVDPEKRLKMRDIMRHPWFTDNGQLSSTNPVSTDLDKIAEEVMDLDNLDLDILSNLKTLWPEFSQQNIIEQLTSKGPNWQKTFYSLLVQHRENFSGDDEEEDEEEEEEILAEPKAGKGNSLGLSLGIASSSAAAPSIKSVAQSPRSPQPPVISSQASPKPPSIVQTAPNASPARPQSVVGTPKIDAPRSPTGPRDSPARMQQAQQPGSPALPAAVKDQRRPVSMVAAPQASPVGKRALPSPMQSPTQSPAKTLQAPSTGFGSAQHAQQTLQPRQNVQAHSAQQRESGILDFERPDTRSSPVRPVHLRAESDNTAAGLRTGSPNTPNRTRLRSASDTDDMTPKQNLPPRPSSRAGSIAATSSSARGQQSTMRPLSAQAHRGDAEQPTVQLSNAVGQATMQQFFREIHDELAAIRVNGERPISLQRKLEQLERMAADVRSEARQGQSPHRSSRRDDDPMAQFDDAEDDEGGEGDAFSLRSATPSDTSSHPYNAASAVAPGLTSPVLKGKPLAVIDKEAYGRMPVAVSAGQRTTSVQSNATTQSTSSTGSGNSLGRRRSLLLGRMRSQKKQSSSSSSSSSSQPSSSPMMPSSVPQQPSPSLAYERLQEAGAMAQRQQHVQPQQQQSRLQARNPGLGLDIGSPALGVAASLKSPTLSTRSGYSSSSTPGTPSTPASSVLMTPGSRSSSQSSPKQSWFAGLFNWKPATCTLMSTENFSVTHAETKRLLLSCGARVFVEDSENAGVLKCSMAEVRVGGADGLPSSTTAGSGSGPSSKPLRFRVEFQMLPMASAASPAIGTPRSTVIASPMLGNNGAGAFGSAGGNVMYASSVTLIQEKGSLATFKQIYNALRNAWTLDVSAASPALGGASSLGVTPQAPIASPLMGQVGLGVSMRGSGASTGGGSSIMSPRMR